jgi:hypothetical protein
MARSMSGMAFADSPSKMLTVPRALIAMAEFGLRASALSTSA